MLSVAAGLALAWDAVEPAVVRAVPTGGLVLIVAMVVLPVVLMAMAGASTLKHRGAAEPDPMLDFEPARTPGAAVSAGLGAAPATGVVRHERHEGDRHERPHSLRPARTRGHSRAGGGAGGVEAGDGMTEV